MEITKLFSNRLSHLVVTLSLLSNALAVPQEITLQIDRNFPDPGISTNGSKAYYAYATSASGLHYPTASAPSPTGPWTWTGIDAMPDLPTWAVKNFWAPDVSVTPDGRWLMYFTAHDNVTDLQCIGVAVADAPLGPFRAVGDRPLICPVELKGAIDAMSFTDDDGSRWVLWKNEAINIPAVLFIQPVTADGTELTGEAVPLLTNDRPEEKGQIEAPFLVRQGRHYVLFYSGGSYIDGSYFESYATATNITGPYTKGPSSWMTTENMNVTGPGGASILRGPDGDTIFFHGWRPEGKTDYRAFYTAKLNWNEDDTPQL